MGFKQSPFPMTEGTKAHSSALKVKELSEFEKAFASARKKQGAGGEFEFKGKKYSTVREDDPSVAGQYLQQTTTAGGELKDVDQGDIYKDPKGFVKTESMDLGDTTVIAPQDEDIAYTFTKGGKGERKITGIKNR